MSKLMSAPISAPMPPLQRFSTAFLPAPDRLAIWREVFGREVIRLDMAPLGDAPMHYEARFLPVHRTTIGIGSASAMSCERTRPLLSDGNDDIILLLPIMVLEGKGIRFKRMFSRKRLILYTRCLKCKMQPSNAGSSPPPSPG